MGTIKFSSPAVSPNGDIAQKYSCDGLNVSPGLKIDQVPAEARSLALIVDDPDAPRGTWTHWVLWDIDPGIHEIAENSIPAGAKEGLNDFGKTTYGGPCPPNGTHRYFFRLFALDRKLELKPGVKRAVVEKAMQGHIVAKAELMGRYTRV